MKGKLTFGMICLLCLALAGCGNKDAEFQAFTGEFEQVTNDMLAKIEADPTADGVDEAQAILDGKKADLKTKWAAIKDARGIQVSGETQKGFEEGMKRSSDKVTGTLAKINDPEAITKYQKLVQDWSEIIDVNK